MTELAPSSYQEHPLHGLAAAIKHEWDDDEAPDTVAALERQPELLDARTIVLDLAYAEYCHRCRRGEQVDPRAFADRFPRYASAVFGVVEAAALVMANGRAILAAARDLWPGEGEEVAGFSILRELGRGSFSRVYLATETAAGDRPVALKLTLAGGDEGCILGQLTHPNVIHVNSAAEDQTTGWNCLCMPFLGTATLTDLLARAFPSPDSVPDRASIILESVSAGSRAGDPEPQVGPDVTVPSPVLKSGKYCDGVAELGRQLADALAFVHGHGVFHRDLKPSNVLLGPGGRPVLLDFNLANDGRFNASRLGGTLPYMAPEQIQAILDGGIIPAELDGRADLFSLGVILYELLSGRLPFIPAPAEADPKVVGPRLLAAYRRGCQPLTRVAPAVPPRLARIVERCLQFRPEERFNDAAELARALGDYLARPRSIRRVACAAAAAVMVLSLGGLLAHAWWSHSQVAAGDMTANQNAQRSVNEATVDLTTANGLFREGRRLMLRGDNARALSHFMDSVNRRRADQENPDGPTLACLSYCLAREGGHNAGDAAFWAEQAQKAGLNSPALFHNVGLAYHRAGDVQKAYEAFTRAIEADPAKTLREPRLWRALQFLPRGTKPRSGTAESAFQDVEDALRIGPPPSVSHYYCAAVIASITRHSDKAILYLTRAVALGAPRAAVRTDPRFVSLRELAEFKKLLPADAADAGPIPSLESQPIDPLFGLANGPRP